jgi:hypothetical protein
MWALRAGFDVRKEVKHPLSKEGDPLRADVLKESGVGTVIDPSNLTNYRFLPCLERAAAPIPLP